MLEPQLAAPAVESQSWRRRFVAVAAAGALLAASGCGDFRSDPIKAPSASASALPTAEDASIAIPVGANIQVVKVEDEVDPTVRGGLERTVDVEYAPNGATIDTTNSIGKYSVVVELKRGDYVAATNDKNPVIGDKVATVGVANGTRDNDR